VPTGAFPWIPAISLILGSDGSASSGRLEISRAQMVRNSTLWPRLDGQHNGTTIYSLESTVRNSFHRKLQRKAKEGKNTFFCQSKTFTERLSSMNEQTNKHGSRTARQRGYLCSDLHVRRVKDGKEYGKTHRHRLEPVYIEMSPPVTPIATHETESETY